MAGSFSDSRGRRPSGYLRLALVQAPGHDGLVRDDHPVGESVQFVPELGVALQVGLHLADPVQQVVGDLRGRRRGGWAGGRARGERGGEVEERAEEGEEVALSPCSSTG